MNHSVPFLTASVLAMGLASAAQASSVTYGGVTFPGGDASFADAVVVDSFMQGPNNSAYDPNVNDPNAALGAPDFVNGAGNDGSFVTLGPGGTITLQFTDNSLTGSDSTALDLWIFEIGADVEATDVEISRDGVDFLSVGSVGGATSGIDIDPFLAAASIDPFTKFSFVRLTDVLADGQTATSGSSTPGADIDAVGAISSAAPDPDINPVPVPAGLPLLLGGLGAFAFLRRRR